MLYEYAIDPATVIEWARDERSFQQFKKAFGFGQPRLVSNFPKRNKWRSLVKNLLSDDLSVHELKRVDAILSAFKGQPNVKRNGPEYDGTKCWSVNVLEQHQWVNFDHLFVAEATECDDDAAFNVTDTFDETEDCWHHQRQQLICRRADDVGGAIGNMLRLADQVLIVDPYFRAEHGQLAILRELFCRLLTGRPHLVRPHVEIFYDLDARGAPSPDIIYHAISARVEPTIFDQIDLVVVACIATAMHNRYILTEHGGVQFGHSFSEDISTTDDITLQEAEIYITRWKEYAERRLISQFRQFPAAE